MLVQAEHVVSIGSQSSTKILSFFNIFWPNMSLPSNRMLFAFFTSFFLVLLCGSRFIHALYTAKVGQQIRDDEGFLLAELHKNKKNTPTMGGLLIAIATIVSGCLWADITSPLMWPLVFSTFFFASIGACDDWAKLKNKSSKGISGRMRLLLQSIFAFSVIIALWNPTRAIDTPSPDISWAGQSISWYDWCRSTCFPFVSQPIVAKSILGVSFIILIQWLAITGSANAVNLTDGLDGLAAGCALLVTAFLSLYAFFSDTTQFSHTYGLTYIQSSGEVAVYLCSLFGALLGFLWFNMHPAQVFMGDTGSLSIGGTLGTASVLLHNEWYLALVGLVFVAETLSVMLQVISFKVRGKRIFRCAPLHHHFEYMGISETKVVMRFWIIAFLLAVLGIVALMIQT